MLALVTGGTRRLGAAIAAGLAADGYDLALHCHAACDVDPELRRAIETAGVRSETFIADLADATAVDSLWPAVIAAFERAPDCLINSASRFGDDSWESASIESFVDHFTINAAAPARLAQHLAAGGGGVVVNILDQRIAAPPRDQAAYTASKLALAGMTDALARALAPGVRVNAVAPGLTIPTADYSPGQMEGLAALMPLGRLPSAGDVAEAVRYLVRAEVVTGQTIFVDGGAHLRRFDRDFVHLARD